MTRQTSFTLLAVLLGSLAWHPVAGAAGNVDGMIKYRQSVMHALGSHNGAASRILRGHVPFEDQLELHARAIRDIAGTIHTLFPKDSYPPEAEFAGATVKIDATAAIGEKPAEFEKATRATVEAAEAFLKVVKSGDAKARHAAFQNLGKTCKACHDNFRKKK